MVATLEIGDNEHICITKTISRTGQGKPLSAPAGGGGTARFATPGPSEDADFEKWYGKVKREGKSGPHSAGDIIDSGTARWRIEGQGRRENPASDETASGSPVWLYDGVEEGAGGKPVQVLALSLRQMGGSWAVLDSLNLQAQACRSLQGWGIPRTLASFEADSSDGDRVFYLVSERPPAASTLQDLLASGLRPTEEQVRGVGFGVWGVRCRV